MATRAQKIRLAIFFVLVNSVLAGFVLFVAGAHILQKRDTYHIAFVGVSVGGLNTGAQVKYQGITAGRVEDTYISPDDIGTVVVEISVDPEKVHNAIRRDTRAVIYNLGITGLKYVELVPGTNESEILPPGSQIQAGETFLADIDRQAEILTSKIELLLDRFALLLGDSNRAHIASALGAADQLTVTTAGIVERNKSNLDSTLTHIAVASGAMAHSAVAMQATMDSLHGLLASDGTRQTLSDIQASARHIHEVVQGPLPELLANMNSLTENVDKTVTHVDQTVVQSRNSLLNAMRDMEEALQNLRELSELVRDNPSILIRGGSRIDDGS
jgi:phospholipid/cholesterol/gamma-HCH transport system substrate-binding protein